MQMGYVRARALLTALAAAVVVTACGGGGGDGAAAPQTGNPPSNNPPTGQNHAPTISGTPVTAAKVGQSYSFQVTGVDSDTSDTLTYSVTNNPGWLSINTATGKLTGTPGTNDVGTANGIKVTVSDGKASVDLAAFSIAVAAASSTTTGSAVLNWTPPTSNTDGSSLTNPGGYKVLYGRTAGQLDQTIAITNPSVSTWTVDNLSSGTWYFAIVTVNAAGTESSPTNVASVAI
jgi:Putative Ig domain